jgi:hypothetical protein
MPSGEIAGVTPDSFLSRSPTSHTITYCLLASSEWIPSRPSSNISPRRTLHRRTIRRSRPPSRVNSHEHEVVVDEAVVVAEVGDEAAGAGSRVAGARPAQMPEPHQGPASRLRRVGTRQRNASPGCLPSHHSHTVRDGSCCVLSLC